MTVSRKICIWHSSARDEYVAALTFTMYTAVEVVMNYFSAADYAAT